MKRFNIIPCLLLVIGLFNCNSDEEFDTSLEVIVKDLEGNFVPNAEVRIYNSTVDFQEERSEVSVSFTNEQGIAIINGLKPAVLYQIDVSKNSLTNWTENTTSPFIAIGENKYETRVYENWYSNLASPSGKSWSAREIRIGNDFFTYLDCFSDNSHKFFKNTAFEFRANSPCTDSDFPSYNGTWLGAKGQITTYDGDEFPHYGLKIISTSPTEFVAEIRENELLIVKFFITNS